ncbi:MAG: hypothetical protein KF859_04075 [Phycisphaeraceae bacterium]|nr:hypothetical protein [Phycisphaeraceae bacterium]
MSISGSAYPVSRSSGQCAASGRAFAEGEHFVATLCERPEPSAPLERVDFSLEAWEGGHRPAPPLALFAVWRSAYQSRPPTRKSLLSDDELVDLFENLAAATDPKQLAFRYVLALLLVRKRLLRLVSQRSARVDQPGALLVHPRGTPPETPPIEVLDPGIDEAATADIIEQVGQLIVLDDNTPGAP